MHAAKRDIKQADNRLDQAHQRFDKIAAPQRAPVETTIEALDAKLHDLEERSHTRTAWLAAHPESVRRL